MTVLCAKRSINLNKVVASFEKHIFLRQTDLTRTGIISKYYEFSLLHIFSLVLQPCTTVLSLKTAFNLVHLFFRIMILIQWSVNISVFVNHVVIVFWGPNEGDRKRTYIPRLFLEYMLTFRVACVCSLPSRNVIS
jgi:hypothetical protein